MNWNHTLHGDSERKTSVKCNRHNEKRPSNATVTMVCGTSVTMWDLARDMWDVRRLQPFPYRVTPEKGERANMADQTFPWKLKKKKITETGHEFSLGRIWTRRRLFESRYLCSFPCRKYYLVGFLADLSDAIKLYDFVMGEKYYNSWIQSGGSKLWELFVFLLPRYDCGN